jgi:quercetin dioxygenase-like cupin family protein
MNTNYVLAAFIAVTLPCTLLVGQQGAHETPSAHAVLYLPADIQWKDGPPSLPPGAKFAVLEGDPTKDGPFVMRARLPDGFHIPAHTHPKPERLTVLSGTFKLAMGDNRKLASARALPAGSYGVLPAGMVHEGWVEGETIMQFSGVGPWVINYLNPADDPRNARKSP